jgi:hypothetical protein
MLEKNTPSIEDIQQSINAAFDSVNLINGIIVGTQDQNQTENNKKSTVRRNVEHLNIMLSKDWFVSGSTAEQLTQMNECISSGSLYTAVSGSI